MQLDKVEFRIENVTFHNDEMIDSLGTCNNQICIHVTTDFQGI